MQIHTFNSGRSQKQKKRVGRGGKRGTTSGRGTKGQKSRSGRRLRPAERDLILRLPKLRGFRNKSISEKPVVWNLSDFASRVKAYIENKKGEVVDHETLLTLGLVRARNKKGVKLLGGGEINFPITIKGITVSKQAKEKIEKAGGKVLDLA